MSDLELYMKLSMLPDDLKQEVIDFIDSLKERISSTSTPRKRKAGLAKGLIEMADDFDAPLESSVLSAQKV